MMLLEISASRAENNFYLGVAGEKKKTERS